MLAPWLKGRNGPPSRSAVVVVAERDFQKLTGKRPGLKEFLMGEGPSFAGLDIARDDACPKYTSYFGHSR